MTDPKIIPFGNTAKEKLSCVERELAFRYRTYRRLMVKGKMSPNQARQEINLMAAIVEDYRALAACEEPELAMFIETARRDGFRVALIDPLTKMI